MSKLNITPRQTKPLISVRVQKQRLERFRLALKKNNHKMTDVIEACIDNYLSQFKS